MSTGNSSGPPAVRQDLVETAVKFLINPKVMNTSSEQKKAFLKKKGLLDSEVEMALSQASSLLSSKVKETNEASQRYFSTGPPYAYHTYIPPQPSVWIKVRDICNTVLLITGASYGLYQLYKNYICPWLTGRQPRTLEDSVVELQQSVVEVLKDVQKTLQSVEQSLTAHNHHLQSIANDTGKTSCSTQQLIELKSEVSSLKGLLLNRKSFPTTPGMSPTIPKWQMSSSFATSPSASGDSQNQTEVDSKDVIVKEQSDVIAEC